MREESAEFQRAARLWQFNAEADPMWAIISDPARAGGKWKPEEFFESGRKQVAAIWDSLKSRGELPTHGSALDFGCGMGRLTQALADHFDSVVGVDVAPKMIELARKHNRHGERVTYLANSLPDLSVLGHRRFDFVLSFIVLQHIPPPANVAYLKELIRVLAPGGVLLVQIPSRGLKVERSWRSRVKRILPVGLEQKLRSVFKPHQPVLDMYPIARGNVEALVAREGDLALSVEQDASAGPHWESFLYRIRRRSV